MKKYKITQKREECLGCGRCTIICEENWEMDSSDYKAKCKKDIIDETEYAKNKEAADECPAQCISVQDCDLEQNLIL